MTGSRFASVAAAITVLAIGTGAALAADGESAPGILRASGVKGGLVVHVGCGDGKLSVDFHAGNSYRVHGLDTDAAQVAAAREHVRSQGLYGPVSVDVFDGEHLPYVDNLVNLLVAGELGGVTMKEVMRVLAPLGVAHVGGQKIVKPWPNEIDEWTHYLHDAGNNAVAQDSTVGPPKRYQWIAGPRWARSHDHLSSLSAMVSAGGRIFYIVDEAPVASVAFKSEWRLVARDAFSGVLLWKRDIASWEDQFRPFRSGPTALAKRLVAVDDRVYVTLGYGKPVSILDAATGETMLTCDHTDNAMELAVDRGIVYAVVGDSEPLQKENTGRFSVNEERAFIETWRPESHWRVWLKKAPLKHLVANDAETGELLWKRDDADTREIMPTAMAVSESRLFIQNESAIIALDAGTGKEIWRSARPINAYSPGSSSPTLVAANGVVICADREVRKAEPAKDEHGRSARWYLYPHTDHARKGQTIAYDAATGKRLWSVGSVENFKAPADVFVMKDTAYVRSYDPGLGVGIDLRTGEARDPPTKKPPIKNPGSHWRCYRNKATERYLILCQRWTEFYDLSARTQTAVSFVRGTCQYGQMPCNGLLYAPHDSCACAAESKLNSFKALSAVPNPTEGVAGVSQFEKGPAYADVAGDRLPVTGEGDWPTYRCDAARSGVAKSRVGPRLKEAWRTTLDGRLTAPVVAGGLLVAASPDNHDVHALDAETGDPVWRFTAGGAVDSPPTMYKGLALFGCADGWLYALRASDGALAWRYRLAPVDRRMVAYGSVESVWPVHGSVLAQDGVVYAVAGRSTSMDGMFFCALEAVTGKKLVEQRIEKASFPDILSSDGVNIFMRQIGFNKEGVAQRGSVPHLFSSAGFLDDTWWHRTYWQHGTGMPGGYTRWFSTGETRPAGRLMVVDDGKVFGFGRRNQYDHVGSHVGLGKMKYLLYASNLPEPAKAKQRDSRTKQKPLRWNQKKPALPSLWERKISLLARGMVLSGDVLFVAGPPDLFGTAPGDAPHVYEPAPAKSLHAQREALAGDRGTLLWAVSAKTGEKLSEYKLECLPAWDGLIAANKRLHVTMQDGTVLCMEEKEHER